MNIREPRIILRKSLQPQKIWNASKALASYALSHATGEPRAWGLPPVLMVEPTAYCNLRCPLCPSGTRTLRRERGFMDVALFKRVVDEIRCHTAMMLLWNQGEPFLHKDFLEMARYASAAGIFTQTSTNGHFLNDPDAVVRSGLDSLIVSLDGATPETYERYRVGGDFLQVVEGIRELTAAKQRLRSETPIVHVQFILFRHNEHEIGEVHRLAKELGADKVTCKTAQIYAPDDVETFLPSDEHYRRYEVVDGAISLKDGHQGVPNDCRRLWIQPTLNWDGTLTPCCFDKHGDFPLGSVADGASMRELWNGEAFNRFRKLVLTNRARFEMCRNCTEGIKLNVSEKDVRVQ